MSNNVKNNPREAKNALEAINFLREFAGEKQPRFMTAEEYAVINAALWYAFQQADEDIDIGD